VEGEGVELTEATEKTTVAIERRERRRVRR
jgi:hypothetical protein